MQTENGILYDGLQAGIFVEFDNQKKAEFLIDTGFSGYLCLPRSVLVEMGLKITSTTFIEGVGTFTETLDAAIATILWCGRRLSNIEVLINDGEDFLLGTGLLENKELYINYKTGEVLITENE